MHDLLFLVLTNIPIISIVAALVWSWILWFNGKGKFGEICARRLLLLCVGITGLWGFFFNAVFPEIVADYFRLQASSFQTHMEMANLAFGVSGVLAFRAKYDFCLAISLISFFYYPGLFLIHVFEIFYFKNSSIGNAGFLTTFDMWLPLFLGLSIYSWSSVQRQKT